MAVFCPGISFMWTRGESELGLGMGTLIWLLCDVWSAIWSDFPPPCSDPSIYWIGNKYTNITSSLTFKGNQFGPTMVWVEDIYGQLLKGPDQMALRKYRANAAFKHTSLLLSLIQCPPWTWYLTELTWITGFQGFGANKPFSVILNISSHFGKSCPPFFLLQDQIFFGRWSRTLQRQNKHFQKMILRCWKSSANKTKLYPVMRSCPVFRHIGHK